MLFIVLQLIILHTVDGHEVIINPEHVTHLMTPKPDEPNPSFTSDVKCMISLDDGKFVTVSEGCDAVRQLLEQAK